MSEDLGRALKAARKLRNATLQQVAEAVGISIPAVQQWESGASTPTTGNLLKVTSFLQVDPAAANRGEVVEVGQRTAAIAPAPPPNVEPALDAPPGEQLMRGERNVPVLGTAVGGADGEFTLNGETIQFIPRPPGLTSVRKLYALYVSNDSMSPRYEHGDLIYVNPTRDPSIGDDVVIELHGAEGAPNGPGYIKRLRSRSASKIVVEQFNPAMEIEFDRAEVKNLHRVVPIRELLGI